MLDPSPYWSTLARQPITWTWQPANAKRYVDFMIFVTSTSYNATGALDWTTKHHQSKLTVKNNMKSKLSKSIVSFVEKCSIW